MSSYANMFFLAVFRWLVFTICTRMPVPVALKRGVITCLVSGFDVLLLFPLVDLQWQGMGAAVGVATLIARRWLRHVCCQVFIQPSWLTEPPDSWAPPLVRDPPIRHGSRDPAQGSETWFGALLTTWNQWTYGDQALDMGHVHFLLLEVHCSHIRHI